MFLSSSSLTRLQLQYTLPEYIRGFWRGEAGLAIYVRLTNPAFFSSLGFSCFRNGLDIFSLQQMSWILTCSPAFNYSYCFLRQHYFLVILLIRAALIAGEAEAGLYLQSQPAQFGLGSYFCSPFKLFYTLIVLSRSGQRCGQSTRLVFYCSMIDCRNKSLVDGLFLGATFRQRLMNCAKFLEYLGPIGSQMPFWTALQSVCMSWPLNGGLLAAISQRMQPSDHTSDLESQGQSRQTYGLTQQGVPVWVCTILFLATLLTFRSPILYRLPTINTLADLRSRCSIFLSWRVFRPIRMSQAAFQISGSGMFALLAFAVFMHWPRSPPSAYSMTTQRIEEPSSKNDSLYAMMYSGLSEANSLTSFTEFCIYLLLREASLTFFSAYSLLSLMRLTRYTELKLPSPSRFIGTKSRILVINNKIMEKGPNPHKQFLKVDRSTRPHFKQISFQSQRAWGKSSQRRRVQF